MSQDSIHHELLDLQARYQTVGEFFASSDFPRWYGHYFEIMVRYARHLFGFDLPTAEDIVQQAYLYLIEHKRDLPLIPGLSLGHLLRYTVRWMANRRYEQRNHPICGALSLSAPELQARNGDTPFIDTLLDPLPLIEEVITTKETLAETFATIQALPLLHRELLFLAALGLSGKEVLQQMHARYPDMERKRLGDALLAARRTVRARAHLQSTRQRQHALFHCRVCRREDRPHAAHQMCATCFCRFRRFQHTMQRQGAADLTPSAMLDAFLLAIAQHEVPHPAFCKMCQQREVAHPKKGMCDPCYHEFRLWQKAQSDARMRCRSLKSASERVLVADRSAAAV